MADTRGCWSLSEAWAEKSADEWIPIPNVWTEPPTVNTAYFMGGGPIPSPKSIVDKMAYSTNTTARVPSCDLGSGRNYVVGGGSKTVGYSIAGRPDYYPGSVIEKITYATDTRESVSSPAGKNRSQHGVAGNADKLYIAAGFQGNPGATNNVVKFTFATETTSPSPNYPSSAIGISASGNQSVGYFGAGSPGSTASQVCKIDYSNDNTGLVPSSGYFTVTRKAALSASSSTGAYWAGGSPGPKSVVDKLTFATDATARIPGANMVNASKYKGGTRSSTAAYWGSETVTFDIMPFETDTCSTLPNGANLSVSREAGVGAVSSRENNNPAGLDAIRWVDGVGKGSDVGYVTMGQGSPGGALRSSTEKLDMVTDTSLTAVPGGNAPFPGMQGGCSFGNNTDGITATGGNQPDMNTDYTYVNKFTYSTETFSSLDGYPGSQTAEGRGYAAGSTGYYVGGFVNMSFPADLSSVNKFAFASDTWSESPSQLNDARYWFANIQNNTEGWALGGYHPSKTNSEKLTFATDTWSSESSTLPSDAKTYYIGGNGSGDATAGYWAGGHPSPGSNKVWKLVYTTGTVSNEFDLTPSSPADNWTLNTGMANETKGYFAGGLWSQGQTEVCKFPYATETASNINPGMTQNRQGAFSFGPRKLGSLLSSPTATPTSPTTNLGIPENGYIAGGFGNVSSISKLDMSSETYTRLDTALYETNKRLTGFGNLTQGYAAGGTSPTRSSCQKFVYSTSICTTLPSTLTASRGYIGSIGNNTAGYVGGGTPQGSQGEKLDKMPYSNETFSSLPSLPGSRYRYGSLGNQTQGYFAGGYPSQTSKVKKITYSSDTYADAPTLSYQATFQTGTGNATKGYVVSGEGAGTKVDRVTFSNDTISRVPSADLSAVRYSMEANNSPSKAYFTGGSPGVKTNTEVITFSNDTTELSTTANADTGDNQAGAYAAFGPNHCGNPGSDIQPNII